MLDWKDMCNLQQAVAVVVPKEAFVPWRELYQRPVSYYYVCNSKVQNLKKGFSDFNAEYWREGKRKKNKKHKYCILENTI